MHSIEFARIEDGLYEIVDENDERLFCIGQILVDDNLRGGFKKALEYTPETGLERHKDFETKLYHARLSPDTVYGLRIKLVDKQDPERVLETDIKLNTLIDLIDSWENLVLEEPEGIIITREQDTFTIQAEGF